MLTSDIMLIEKFLTIDVMLLINVMFTLIMLPVHKKITRDLIFSKDLPLPLHFFASFFVIMFIDVIMLGYQTTFPTVVIRLT